jgi:hypothetical protein
MTGRNRSSHLQRRDLNRHITHRSLPMISYRTLAIAAAMSIFCVTGYAQTPVEHDTNHPAAASTGNMPMPRGGPDAQMTQMDEQMQTMQGMHDKMMAAKTPEARSALMTEHMKVMQDSMAMMGKVGIGAMGGMKDKPATGADTGGMPDMQAKDPMDGAMGTQHQMMDKRMQMMQSMMQMMLDRMPPAPGQ